MVASALVNRTLRRVHRNVLIGLALCAVWIAVQGQSDGSPLARQHAVIAVGLALVTIVSRRVGSSPNGALRVRAALLLTSMLCALAIGIVGVVISAGGVDRQTGLVLIVAAAIFCLRPPPSLEAGNKAPGQPRGQSSVDPGGGGDAGGGPPGA